MTKLRRSVLGRHVNRETEQSMINLICSFLVFATDSGYSNRLKVFVRKNRYLGAVYVEQYQTTDPKRMLCRSLYKQCKWITGSCYNTKLALRHLRSAMLHSMAGGVPICTISLMEDILDKCTRLSLY